MQNPAVRARFFDEISAGRSVLQAAAALGVPQSTAYWWRAHPHAGCADPGERCWQCTSTPPSGRVTPYLYLLGQYLGDGHLVTRARVPVLRIYACLDYPAIVDEISDTIRTVRGHKPGLVGRKDSDRVAAVQSYWTHWPCLFPQHGPGLKHTRSIVLAEWQRDLVARHPWPLIRGLIHSDGCRAMNVVTVRGKTYSYPRYFFANESRDIHRIMGDALDAVGVQWRFNRSNSISVARRASVELMEQHIGPKR